MFGDRRPTTGALAALAYHAPAIGTLELDEVVVKDLPVTLGIAHLASAHALPPHWMSAFDPVDHVKVVDVLLDDVVAREPGEVIPVANLVVHLRFARQPLDPIA